MRSRRLTPWNILWLILAVLYFFVPLWGTLEFSLETGVGKYGLDAYGRILHDSQFWDSFLFSLKLAVATVAASTVLMVPTVYWVHLRLPKIRPVMDFLAILPFVVPPIVLAVGVEQLFHPFTWLISGPQILVFVYVILVLPFTYRSLDAGMRSIDLQTLTEAAQSVGARGSTILFSVILPNLIYAMLSSAFLSLTLVMGEYTISSLLLFNSFPVYIQLVGDTLPQPAAALAMISFVLTWSAMLGVLLIGGGVGRRQVQIGAAR